MKSKEEAILNLNKSDDAAAAQHDPVSVRRHLFDIESVLLHSFHSGDAESLCSSTESLCTEAISDDEEILKQSTCSEVVVEDTDNNLDEEHDEQVLLQKQESFSKMRPLALNRKRRRQTGHLAENIHLPKKDALWLPRPHHNYDDGSPFEPVLVLGVNISHLSRASQFLVCASGVFGFNLLFGYLQELINMQIFNRNLGLFLAMSQFSGYTAISFLLRTYVVRPADQNHNQVYDKIAKEKAQVPSHMYWTLGVLSALDLSMTNMSMHYLNYPAKTLMKSSRVIFTMIFGVLIAHKKYRIVDYVVVLFLVMGLCVFMQADKKSSAVFEPMGVVMLTISLLCDGATNIVSEIIMKSYGVGQDELIFRTYSLALIAVTAAAMLNGDLWEGLAFLFQPGTYDEWQDDVPEEEACWSVAGKIAMVLLFSSMGFLGSSCSAAITKNFGALTMSVTSTARRATTLFLSFLLFENECTQRHITGVIIFIAALATKSIMGHTKNKAGKDCDKTASHPHDSDAPLMSMDLITMNTAPLDLDLTMMASPPLKKR